MRVVEVAVAVAGPDPVAGSPVMDVALASPPVAVPLAVELASAPEPVMVPVPVAESGAVTVVAPTVALLV